MAPTIGDFFTAVPGVVHATKIPASVGEILIRNDSPYDQWVKFNFAPTAAPSPLTFAQYDLEVTPGREQIIPPPGFNGGLWIGCYNPGGKAASGTISSRANVYVRYYPQGQSAGAGAAYSALTGLDTTSQQRVISIPTEPHVSGFVNVSISDDVRHKLGIPLATGQSFSGSQSVTVYLYGWIAGIISGGRKVTAQLFVSGYDNGGVEQESHSLADLPLSTNHGTITLMPNWAIPVQFTPHATTTNLDFSLSLANGWPSPVSTAYIIFCELHADIDLTGQTPPPAIGNGAGTPPGAIY